MFPISHKAEITISTDSPDTLESELMQNIKHALKKQSAENIRKEDHTIFFAVGAYKMRWPWELLSLIAKGQISINVADDCVLLQYGISFRYSYIIENVLFLLLLLIIAHANLSFTLGVMILPLFIYSLNYVISIFRFNKFIKQCILVSNSDT